MPSFLPIDGCLLEVDDNIFETIVQALHQQTAPTTGRKTTTINLDGSYMTNDPLMKTISINSMKTNSQHFSPAQIIKGQYQANPTF